MSTQNQKTLEAYERIAKNYLKGAQVFNEKEMEWAQGFIADSLHNVVKGGKILEVGSADGNNASFMRELGYDVTASDVANDFLTAIKARGFEPVKFNLLIDSFPDKYSAVFCWKVFVHFTKEDILKALKRSSAALEDGGIFMFCVIDKACKAVDYEWADFPGVFHVGADRYFHYYSKEELDAIIEKAKFAISDCRSYTADNGVKWLAYSLRKKRKMEMKTNFKLEQYIKRNIFPIYDRNEPGHGINHINEVIARSFELAEENQLDVNPDIVFTVAAFHDLGHHVDSKKHEIISAKMMMNDKVLPTFFTDDERLIIKEAIEDHRASGDNKKPRSAYGEIVSSADRNTTIEACLRRSYTYGKRLKPDATDEELFERAHYHLSEKFGVDGYAKFYFKDKKYERFLKDIRELLGDKDLFIKTQREYIARLKKEQRI